MGQINITHLVQLGYKPGRLIDIWELYYGRQAQGCCMWCNSAVVPMRIMRKCANMRGCYPSSDECFVVVDSRVYPGVYKLRELPHRERAKFTGLVCQNCWVTTASSSTII